MKWITEVMEDNASQEQKETIKNLKLNNMSANTIPQVPRRNRLDLCTPAEMAIYNAVQEVEKLAADVRLTDAVTLLQQAREKVADFIDDVN